MAHTWRDAIRNMPPDEAVEHLSYLLEELTWAPAHGLKPVPGVRLEPALAKLLYRLDASRGKVVPHSALAAALADTRPGDVTGDVVVKVQICRLRQRLRGTGVEIETVWCAGYRLLPGPALDWSV